MLYGRFGSKSDFARRPGHFRLSTSNGHRLTRERGPLFATTGLLRRTKLPNSVDSVSGSGLADYLRLVCAMPALTRWGRKTGHRPVSKAPIAVIPANLLEWIFHASRPMTLAQSQPH